MSLRELGQRLGLGETWKQAGRKYDAQFDAAPEALSEPGDDSEPALHSRREAIKLMTGAAFSVTPPAKTLAKTASAMRTVSPKNEVNTDGSEGMPTGEGAAEVVTNDDVIGSPSADDETLTGPKPKGDLDRNQQEPAQILQEEHEGKLTQAGRDSGVPFEAAPNSQKSQTDQVGGPQAGNSSLSEGNQNAPDRCPEEGQRATSALMDEFSAYLGRQMQIDDISDPHSVSPEYLRSQWLNFCKQRELPLALRMDWGWGNWKAYVGATVASLGLTSLLYLIYTSDIDDREPEKMGISIPLDGSISKEEAQTRWKKMMEEMGIPTSEKLREKYAKQKDDGPFRTTDPAVNYAMGKIAEELKRQRGET